MEEKEISEKKICCFDFDETLSIKHTSSDVINDDVICIACEIAERGWGGDDRNYKEETKTLRDKLKELKDDYKN